MASMRPAFSPTRSLLSGAFLLALSLALLVACGWLGMSLLLAGVPPVDGLPAAVHGRLAQYGDEEFALFLRRGFLNGAGFTDAALEFVGAKADRPFLCYVAYNAPHAPLQVPDKYLEPYQKMNLAHSEFPNVGHPLPGKADEATTARVYAMVTNIDDNVGRLLAKREETKQADNTIVIFMTDNGPQQVRYNAGMLQRKGSVHEGGIRVPCYWRWPGQFTAGHKVSAIAAHIDVLSPAKLYDVCAAMRAALGPRHAVGRVIARPFAGEEGAFRRTDGRRDFALAPPQRSYLQEIQDTGVPVHGVGKVVQLFAGAGFDVEHAGPTNARALAATTRLMQTLERGLVFTNLVDTDQVYGHRHDAPGFYGALREIDACVAQWLDLLRGNDLLLLTADHGCDVTAPHTDHTREHAPLLAVFPGHGSRRHDGPLSDVGASALAWLTGRDAPELPGRAFVPRQRDA